MNNDLISRSALLHIVGQIPLCWEYGQAVSDIYKIVKEQPAVDIEAAQPKFEYIKQLENQHAEDDKTMDRLFAEKEAIQRDFGDFAARINAGEDVMACEYCEKNYAEGECSCNCLKDFEWRGLVSLT